MPTRLKHGQASLLCIESNGVRTVIVEDASRFARELMTQELGILTLIKRDVRVFTASGDELTDNSDPSRVMMRQIAGAFHQYEKARLVAKLKAARDRKRATGAKVEGRKSYSEARPETVALARQLAAQPHMSLRKVAAALADAGHLTAASKPFSHTSVEAMLKGSR